MFIYILAYQPGCCIHVDMSQVDRWIAPGTALIDLPRPLAFVLSGGSAAGAVQVGMLQALSEAGVVPDMVVATSVGAINGAMVAAGPEVASDRLRDIWLSLDRSDILGTLSLRTIAKAIRSRSHVFDGASLLDLIGTHLPVATFEQLNCRFGAVVTNANTGRPEVLTDGCLKSSLMASAAIPGFFPNVSIGDRIYFDGGVTANVPVRQAISLGAKSVVVLDAGQVPSDIRSHTNIAGSIQFVLGLMTRNQRSSIVELEHRKRVVTLPLVTPAGLGCFDFSRTPELIERAYLSTRTFIEDGCPPLTAESEWPRVATSSRVPQLV